METSKLREAWRERERQRGERVEMKAGVDMERHEDYEDLALAHWININTTGIQLDATGWTGVWVCVFTLPFFFDIPIPKGFISLYGSILPPLSLCFSEYLDIWIPYQY